MKRILLQKAQAKRPQEKKTPLYKSIFLYGTVIIILLLVISGCG